MRFFYVSILGMAAVSIAGAGQIEIGAGMVGNISTQGLTAAYIGATTWSEKNYVNNLFTNDTLSNSTLNGVTGTGPTGTGSTLPTAANGFQQFTDPNNGVTFGMMDDGGNGNNFWASPGSATTTVSSTFIPVDVSGVTSANLILSDYFGVAGQVANDTVEFFFNGGAFNATFNLTNGTQISSAHDCMVGNPTCPNFSGSTTSPSSDKAWAASYAEGTNLTAFSGTSGTVSLVDRTYNLSGFGGDVLTGIELTDNFNLTNSSRLTLSAITVSGADAELATPEPSSVLLLFGGLGAIGFLARRRMARL